MLRLHTFNYYDSPETGVNPELHVERCNNQAGLAGSAASTGETADVVEKVWSSSTSVELMSSDLSAAACAESIKTAADAWRCCKIDS